MLAALIEKLRSEGKKVEVIDGELYVEDKHMPIVKEGDTPYRSDCPHGVCSVD